MRNRVAVALGAGVLLAAGCDDSSINPRLDLEVEKWTQELGPAGYPSALWAPAPGLMFAVGINGHLARYNGSRWTLLPPPELGSMSGIWGAAPDNVVVVGFQGQVYRYDGSGYHREIDVSGTFRGVAGLSATDIVAVGSRGLVRHFRGSAWVQEPAGTTRDLNAVAAADGIYFAVGDEGAALRLGPDGTWAALPPAGNQNLIAVWAPSGNEMFAASDGGVFRFHGGAWTTISTGLNLTSFVGIGGSSAADVWVAGYQGAARWDGSTWTRERDTRGRAIHVFPNGDVAYLSDHGLELRESGVWRTMSTGLDFTGITAMTGVSDDDFVLFDGFGPSLRRAADAWVVLQDDPARVDRAWTDPRNGDVYIVGRALPAGPSGDSVIRLRGDAFQEVYTVPGRTLTAVWGSGDELFAAGEEGTLVHFDGAGWSVRELEVPARNRFLHAVGGASPGEVYAVATDRVHRYDGSDWESIGSWDEAWFLDEIAVRGPDDVFVLGTRDVGATDFVNVILHYDGSTWTEFFTSADNESVTGIAVVPGGDVVAVGYTLTRDPTGLAYRFSSAGRSRELGGSQSGGFDGVWVSPGGRVHAFSHGVWARRSDIPW